MEKKFEEKILLVDDNVKNLQIAMNILKDYNVIYAQSAKKALELVEQNTFDLILLDVVMPEMNGYEACKILKSNEKTKDIPIIFLTVKDDEQDIVQGLEIGAVDYITKPFYSQVLLKRVELHLKLANSFKQLNKVNKNLNEIVEKQIEDIRKKDEILFKHSKILAVSQMIDMMTEQFSYPLGLIMMQNQALDMMLSSETATNQDIQNTINLTMKQLNYLNMTIEDFKSFFKSDVKSEQLCLNVMINSALLFFKDIFIKEKIQTQIKGDINLNIYFIKSELKHILIKLVFNIIYLMNLKAVSNKKISICFEEFENYIELCFESNIKDFDEVYLTSLFDNIESKQLGESNYFMGLHLIKIVMEKNNSSMEIAKKNGDLVFIIKFFK